MVVISGFRYLQTPTDTPSMPHECLLRSISRIVFISASCTAIILLLWLHPLWHPSPCVTLTGQLQICIASLFFNTLCTPISQPLPPHSSRLFLFAGEKRAFRDLLSWWLLYIVHPCTLFVWLSLNSNTFKSLSLLCIVSLSVSLIPSPLSFCPASCLRPKRSSSSALHAEILCEGREPGGQRGGAWGLAWGYRRQRRG